MDKWLEVLDGGGNTHYVDPGSIIRIVLGGNKHAEKGVVLVTTNGEIKVSDPGTIATLRAFAFEKAGQDQEGNYPTPKPVPAPRRSVGTQSW